MTFLDKYRRKLGVLEYLGTWNAATNTPALASSVGQRGGYYVVGTGGSTALNGVSSWQPGDWVVFNGSAYEKIDNTDQVTSVAGKTGAVTLVSADVTDFTSAVEAIRPRYTRSTTIANTNTNGTYTTVSELTTGTLPVGMYKFFFAGLMQSTQIAFGVGVRIQPVSATVTTVSAKFNIAQGLDGVSHDFEYDQTAAATNVTSSQVSSANANFSVNGVGIFRVSSAGSVGIQICTETNGQTATLQPDAVLIVEPV